VLKSIRVTNFKVIEDSTLLALQPLMVVIGRNGSGKSSLIEALDWLGRAVSEGAEAATESFQRMRDVINGWDVDHARTFGITLVFDPQDASVGEEVTYRIEVGADETGHLPLVVFEELTAQIRGTYEFLIRTEQDTQNRQVRVPAGVSERPTLTEYRERRDRELEPLRPTALEYVWRTIGSSDRLALADLNAIDNRIGEILRNFLARALFLRLNPRRIADFSPSRVKPSPRLLDEEGTQLAHLLGKFDEEMLSIMIEKLSFILQRADTLQTHQPTGPADRRFFSLTERRGGESDTLEIPAWTLSEGTRRITAILAVLLTDEPPPLVCIEEVENGLDPWTIKYLLDELAGAVLRGTQVILTSHSPYLLNLLPLEAILFCHRQVHSVEFAAGDSLPELEVLHQRMGPGDLYSNRYFHRSVEESPE
jgi:predicted ATPase